MTSKSADVSQTSSPPVPFRPFIADETRLRELTPLPLIMGTLLGIVFGASSLYLVLKTSAKLLSGVMNSGACGPSVFSLMSSAR